MVFNYAKFINFGKAFAFDYGKIFNFAKAFDFVLPFNYAKIMDFAKALDFSLDFGKICIIKIIFFFLNCLYVLMAFPIA